MAKDLKAVAEQKAQELLNLMAIKASLSLEESANGLVVNIETEDAGILIGRHGETISALQLILNQIVHNEFREETSEWQRIIVNCGDYRERQEESLRNLALNTIARVKETGQEQQIYDLTPPQRRIVHMVLSKNPEITSESEGEGRDRHIVVKLAK